MIADDPTGNIEIDGSYTLILTEDGFWGFLPRQENIENKNYYTESWIRNFNEAKEPADCGFLGLGTCHSEMCSDVEKYSSILVVTTPAIATKETNGLSETIKVNIGSVYKYIRGNGNKIYGKGFDPQKAECDSSKEVEDFTIELPSNSVKKLDFDTDLTPSWKKKYYIRDKRMSYIRKGFAKIPRDFETRCGDKTTVTVNESLKEIMKQEVSAAFERLGANFSYDIEWTTEHYYTETIKIEKSPSRETFEQWFVTGDGLATASLSRIAECEKDHDTGVYKSLRSEADWFIQYRPEYPRRTFTFDCHAADSAGLLLDQDVGKLELNNGDDIVKFEQYLGKKELLGSTSLLLKEITEWKKPLSEDHCPKSAN